MIFRTEAEFIDYLFYGNHFTYVDNGVSYSIPASIMKVEPHTTQLSMDEDYLMESPSIRCPRCGRTSYNPGDIEHRYCGYCHMHHADMDRKE